MLASLRRQLAVLPMTTRRFVAFSRPLMNRRSIQVIRSDAAPEYTLGLPRHQAVIIPGNCDKIYTSALFGIDGQGKLVSDDVVEQTKQLLSNLEKILNDADSSLEYVVKTHVYLTDIKDFEKVNLVYKEYFKKFPPTRDCFAVKELYGGAKISISAIALPLKQVGLFWKYIGRESSNSAVYQP